MQYILGVDSSTSATKVIAFDAQGNVRAAASRQHPVYTPQPGWVEQDAADWWTAFVAGCREVLAHPDIDVKKIAALGLTHQRFTFVPVDQDLRPLRRAILWNDLRCAQEAALAAQTIGTANIFDRTGYPPAQWTLYKVLWLKQHEPEVYDRMFKVMLVQNFLTYHLTGNLVINQGSCAMTGALDIVNPTQWATDIITALGLREDHWIQPILPCSQVMGYVTAEAARETGLPEGLPVITGGGDQPCGVLGAGIVEPGTLGINGGTSCTNELICRGLPERKAVDYHVEISPAGSYIVENCIPSGGSAVMNWYKANFGYADVAQAEREGRNVWDVIYNQAAESPAGNRGMLIVPYFQGANGPYWDLNARALIFGVQSDHGRPQLIRGLMEGLAYESRREAELMAAGAQTQIAQIRMYGGSAKSDHWNQIFADVFNLPVQVPDTTETTALGAAISASVGSGVYADFQQAVAAMVRLRAAYTPIAAHVARYERFYREVYVKLYDRVQEFNHIIANINAQ